jgi:hypothetical protein
VWAMVKPFLDPVVKSKIFILGSNYRSTLLEHIDADSLPAEYGGTCQCEGGCVPHADYALAKKRA